MNEIVANDKLGAFCRHTHVEMKGAAAGPLAGRTFAAKDIYDVAGYARPAVATALLTAALAYTIGSVYYGDSSDRLASAGVSRMTTYKAGVVISLAMNALDRRRLHAIIESSAGAVSVDVIDVARVDTRFL